MSTRELVQLATDWDGDVPAGGCWAEEKYNGIRALYIGADLVTREGVTIHGTDHIRAALSELERIAGVPTVFDGEFVAGGSFDATLSHFGRGARASNAGTLHLFDALPFADWRRGGTDEPLHERAKRLGGLLAEWQTARAPLSWECEGRADAEPLAIVESHWLNDRAEIDAAASEIWARGGEGIVIKDAESGYVRGRTRAWQKVKQTARTHLPFEAMFSQADGLGRESEA